MDFLATLLLAHLIADFPLQTNWIFGLKQRHWAGVLLHSAIHSGVTALLVQDALLHWPLLVSLCGIHFAIDWFKLRAQFKFESLGFVLDQAAHLLSLLVLTNWLSQVTGVLPPEDLNLALAYALIPFLLMFLTVLLGDPRETVHHPVMWTSQRRFRIIVLSHLAGYPLVVGVLALRMSMQG